MNVGSSMTTQTSDNSDGDAVLGSFPTSLALSGGFATTRWSVVLQAGGDSTEAFEALTRLCRSYWYPLYSYARRRGHSPEDAADLTQDFFARFLEKGYVSHADPTRGRFRSFLLTSMKNFLAGEHVRAKAAKRGGGGAKVSLDDEAEHRFQTEPATEFTPDRVFDRNWALALMQNAMDQLQRESATAGKKALFDSLKPFLARESVDGEYDELRGALGMSANSVAVAVHRMRERYRALVRLEVGKTVAQSADVEEEMRYLLSTLVDDAV